MSIELQTISKTESETKSPQDVVEHSTQEVGVNSDLPHIYSNTGRYEDSYVGSMDTYGTYSKGGMYGNHASLNYLFGNLGGETKPTNTKPQTASIRYDSKGTILNYTSKVASMFLLKEREDLMGENILDLIEPNFKKTITPEKIDEAFGVNPNSAEITAELDKQTSITCVRTNGESFVTNLKIVKITNNVITAQFVSEDSGEDIQEVGEVRSNRSASSSSFSSYVDTYSSNQRRISSMYGGVVVDMNELNEGDEWIGTGRYTAGKEEVYNEQNEAQRAGISAVSLTAFSDLRRSLENGVLLLDTQAETLSDVINALLDEAEMKGITTAEIRDPTLHVFERAENAGQEDATTTKEGCKVFVTKLSFLTKPLVGLVRLHDAMVINDKSGLSIRYFLFVLGSSDCTSTSQLHEMGRAFSLMMSQNWFSRAARKVGTPSLFLKLMDNFMTRCMMLPPPDPLAENPFQVTSSHVGGGCCGKVKNQETVMLMMPNTTLQRTNHQLRHRQRVLNQHDNALMNAALQQEPTVEELEKEKPAIYISRLTTRDKIVGAITFIICVCVAVLLNVRDFQPYDDELHVTDMLGYSMSIPGGFNSIIAGSPERFSLPNTPRGLYEVRVAIQRGQTPYVLSYVIKEATVDEIIDRTETVIISSDTEKETESLEEFDFMDEVYKAGESELYIEVTTNSTTPVGFAIYAESMNPIGRYRILLGSILLIAVYVVLLLEVINRAVVAFIGAFLTLLLISFISEAPSLTTVVNWMDESTLCLLFGMMIMIQMLSTTGLFEYLAVSVLTLSKGNILILNLSLCLLTAVCSAFLDNVTTMLLIAPVTIELSRMMKVDPVPFLLPEVIYSNIGGTATQIGDPPNIIIGNMLKKHIGFMDFIKNCTPDVIVCMIFVYPFIVWYYKKELLKPNFKVDTSLKEKYQIKNKPLLLKCGTILATVIIMFFLHPFHEIDTAYIAIAGAFACLFLGTNEDLHTTFELLEWETLVFFAGLFIMIEGINEIGVIRAIGNAVAALIEKAPAKWQSLLAHMLILWVSGLASSVLDNIAFTATMIPVIQILAEHPELDFNIYTLAWVLAFGACFGGNGTLVGAGANLVTAGISASNGHPITFGMFFKFGFTCMMITMIVTTIYTIIRYV